MPQVGKVAESGSGASTVKWTDGLKAVPQALDEIAAHYRRLARAAMEDHPMNGALRDRLLAAAIKLERVAEMSRPWHHLVRNTGSTAADNDAYFAPRDGSVQMESKADVRRAYDGN